MKQIKTPQKLSSCFVQRAVVHFYRIDYTQVSAQISLEENIFMEPKDERLSSHRHILMKKLLILPQSSFSQFIFPSRLEKYRFFSSSIGFAYERHLNKFCAFMCYYSFIMGFVHSCFKKFRHNDGPRTSIRIRT